MARNVTQKMSNKMKTVKDIVCSLKPIYDDPSNTTEQKGILLNTVGAAIFYIGSLDSGKHSVACVGYGGKTVEDHFYSRKRAAQLLMETPENKIIEVLCELIVVNTLTKEEHSRLTSLSKKNTSMPHSELYEKAGIELCDKRQS